MADKPPTALVLYHFLYPDEVVSSVLFSELCAGLAVRGWRVVGCACNREWGHEEKKHPLRVSWNDVEFRRVWRPEFSQSSGFGRLANAVWMIAAWSLMALDWRLRPDVVIIGTDPVLSPLVALAWRALRPGVKVAHWCFDLYPEAAVAAGMLVEGAIFVRTLKRLLGCAYGRCALVVDIGSCMRRRLGFYTAPRARKETITPLGPGGTWFAPASGDPAEEEGAIRGRDHRPAVFWELWLSAFVAGHSGVGQGAGATRGQNCLQCARQRRGRTSDWNARRSCASRFCAFRPEPSSWDEAQCSRRAYCELA